MASGEKHFGKFRGTVTVNVDPEKLGRIKARVPDVSKAEDTSWALPCVPVAGDKSGAFFLPPVGARVWIEFEQGETDHPIWAGGFWEKQSELPPPALDGDAAKPSIVLQSNGGHQLVISDKSGDDGGLLLKVSGGAKIQINDKGITIDNGKGAKIAVTDSGISIDDGKGAKLELQGNSVQVNGGALTVM